MCVSARLVRLAFSFRSWLLNVVSSCQGRSLCLQGRETVSEASQDGHVHLAPPAPSQAGSESRPQAGGLLLI